MAERTKNSGFNADYFNAERRAKAKIKVIGNVPDFLKKRIEEAQEGLLFQHFQNLPENYQKLVKEFSRPKSREEEAVIGLVNEITNKLMEEAGKTAFEISPENIHLIPPEEFRKVKGRDVASAFTSPAMECIVVEDRRMPLLLFALIIAHEILHLKGLQIFQVGMELKEGDLVIFRNLFRQGISASASRQDIQRGRGHTHFRGLQEAIIEEQVKKMMPEILASDVFDSYRQWLSSVQGKAAWEKATKAIEGSSIPSDEISYVGPEGDITLFAYLPQRQVLRYICEEIQKEFSQKYRSPDEVFKEFLKAHFAGSLLTIGRLVEQTFGGGSFRLLGNMEMGSESAVLCLEALEKSRARFLRKKLKTSGSINT